MQDRSDKNRIVDRLPMKSSRKVPEKREPMSRDELRHKRYLERRRRRRRNLILGYSAAIVVVIILAVVLSLTVFFKISSFEVAGDEVYSAEQIIEASGLKNGENLFGFEKEDVSAQVEQTLPYVGNIEIKRSMTGKITFTVTAAKAVMAIDNGESYCLLDRNCKVLETETLEINDDVAVIKTSAALSVQAGQTVSFENETDAETLVMLQDVFEANEITGITQIDITDASNLKMRYNMRILLKIGPTRSFADKAQFIKATLTKLDSEDPAYEGTMDFTIDNKAFVNEVDEEKTTLPPPAETAEGETVQAEGETQTQQNENG